MTAFNPTRSPVLAFVLAFLVTLPCIASDEANAEQHLTLLCLGDLEVGVLPELGGRIVLLRKQGGDNLLREDQTHWHPNTWPQTVNVNTRRSAFFGHIHWLAPQSAWWAQQDIDPQRRGQQWPPDPFLELGRHEVVEHSANRLVLRSPHSPVSGICLTKTIELLSEHSLRIAAEARNIRTTPVHWGLWSCARFPADTRFRSALAGFSANNIRYSEGAAFRGVVSDDSMWFSFANDPESLQVTNSLSSKAFIDSPAPRFEILFDDWILVTTLEAPEPNRTHSEHASLEVFLMKHPQPEQGFLELEFHGAYTTLKSNQTVTISELWELYPADDFTGE